MHVFSCKVVLYGVTVQSHQSAPRNTVLGSCARAAQQQIALHLLDAMELRGTKDTRSTLEVWLRWSCLWIFRVVHRATGYCNITHVGFLLKMLYCILSILSSIYHNSAGAQLVDWGVQLKSPPGYGIAMVAFSDGFWEASLELLSSLLEQKAQPDVVCCTTIIRTCAAAAEWRTRFFWGEIPRSKLMQFWLFVGEASDIHWRHDMCWQLHIGTAKHQECAKDVAVAICLKNICTDFSDVYIYIIIIMGLPACVRTNLVPTSFPHVFCCCQCFLCAGFLHGPTYRKTCSYPSLQHNMPEILERDLCIYIHRSERRWRNGGSVRGHDKPVHGSCAIYFPDGITI